MAAALAPHALPLQTIREIQALDPRAFLNRIRQFPSLPADLAADFMTPIVMAVQRITLVTLLDRITFLFKKSMPHPGAIRLTDAASVDAIVGLTPDQKATLNRVLVRMREIEGRLRLRQLNFYLEPPVYNYSEASCNEDTIFLGRALLDRAEEETLFVVTHEMAHIKHRDVLKKMIANVVIVALSIIAFVACPIIPGIGVIFLIELIAFPILKVMEKQLEWRADQLALKTLNSNQGAVQFFHHKLRNNFVQKHAAREQLLEMGRPITEDEFIQMHSQFTPSGENRSRLSHPKLADRLLNALEFQPV